MASWNLPAGESVPRRAERREKALSWKGVADLCPERRRSGAIRGSSDESRRSASRFRFRPGAWHRRTPGIPDASDPRNAAARDVGHHGVKERSSRIDDPVRPSRQQLTPVRTTRSSRSPGSRGCPDVQGQASRRTGIVAKRPGRCTNQYMKATQRSWFCRPSCSASPCPGRDFQRRSSGVVTSSP